MAAAGASPSLFISHAATDASAQRKKPLWFPGLRRSLVTPCACLSSGSDSGGSGGVSSSDDANHVSPSVSSGPNMLEEGFTVMANTLMGIEPLDESVISEGVSRPAMDSMKHTVSRLLGVLPFSVDGRDQFSFSVRASFHPLFRLLVSAITTGYTLQNAEYRMCLKRSLDLIQEDHEAAVVVDEEVTTSSASRPWESTTDQGLSGFPADSLEISPPDVSQNLSPEALDYIQRLQLELANTMEELDAQKQEMKRIENGQRSRNHLVEYVRSLGPVMVTRISRPSSVEVEDIIHHLVKNTLRKISNNDSTSNFVENTIVANGESKHDGTDVACDTIATSRDYLAKLLLWCMLLGHHLRGLENGLLLSSIVGLQ